MHNTRFSLHRLGLHLLLDAVGMLSYLAPGIGETLDAVWAPFSSYLLLKMYPGTTGKAAAIIEFAEEILPFTDFIPTFTLTYLYTLWENRHKAVNSSKPSNPHGQNELPGKKRNNNEGNEPV